MGRVRGIGGVFFKCDDPEAQRNWYRDHLGLNTDQYGTTFTWRQASDPEQKGYTQWSPFKASSDYFEGNYMINYRVDDLEGLVADFKASGVPVLDDIQVEDYGKFVHIRDPEGNRVELWEPNDTEYEKILSQTTS